MASEQEENDKTKTHVTLTDGTMVSHYRIIEKIGAGGTGEACLISNTSYHCEDHYGVRS